MRSRVLLALPMAAALAATAGATVAQPADALAGRTPSATTGAGNAVSAVQAVVDVVVDPLGLLTRYSVEYGTTTDYGRSTPVTTVTGNAGTGNYDVPLDNLNPSTVYHYRVVATNALGTTDGTDETLSTWPVQLKFLGHGVISKNNQVTRPASGKPRGWVMVIHGGGWQSVGREAVASEDGTVDFVTQQGWAADNVDYRKGEHSLPDVLAAYDALRAKVGTTTPICLIGHSAGGNLALLVAEYRKSVSCVISEAGPTDLVDFPDGQAYGPVTVDGTTYSPQWAYEEFMVTSFGIDPKVLDEWSPVRRAGRIDAPLLLGASTHDELVPQTQMTELKQAMRSDDASGTIKTALLAGASTPTGQSPNFTHASVTSKALARWQRDERRLLARVAAGR